MSKFETFPNAPITEALLDIQFSLPTGSEGGLQSFEKILEGQFPERQERLEMEQSFKLGPQNVEFLSNSKKTNGFLRISKEKGKLVQIRREGFSFHKLKKYKDWPSLSGEAKTLWMKFCEHVEPTNVNRVGIRYINRIEIPLPIEDIRNYCVLFPEFPKEMPQSLSGFFMRFTMPDLTFGSTAIVTLTFENPVQGAISLPLILDIDAFYSLTIMDPKSDDIWKLFDNLRDLKNRIFFSSLTECAKSLFR
jgi:uncharacterized protein (TIGR04255 family)